MNFQLYNDTFLLGVAVGGAAVWFAKAKIISWYDALVAKI